MPGPSLRAAVPRLPRGPLAIYEARSAAICQVDPWDRLRADRGSRATLAGVVEERCDDPRHAGAQRIEVACGSPFETPSDDSAPPRLNRHREPKEMGSMLRKYAHPPRSAHSTTTTLPSDGIDVDVRHWNRAWSYRLFGAPMLFGRVPSRRYIRASFPGIPPQSAVSYSTGLPHSSVRETSNSRGISPGQAVLRPAGSLSARSKIKNASG